MLCVFRRCKRFEAAALLMRFGIYIIQTTVTGPPKRNAKNLLAEMFDSTRRKHFYNIMCIIV